MSVCLDYQLVSSRKKGVTLSLRVQVAAAMLLLAALSGKVWIKIQSTDVGYDLARERKSTVALDMERRELELQRSILLRPDNLFKRAQDRLKLGHLRPEQARTVQY